MLVVMGVAVTRVKVAVRYLLKEEETPDAKYDNEVVLHRFLAVSVVAFLTSMDVLVAVVVSLFVQVWQSMEKHIAKQAPHCKRKQNVSKILALRVALDEADVHAVN